MFEVLRNLVVYNKPATSEKKSWRMMTCDSHFRVELVKTGAGSFD